MLLTTSLAVNVTNNKHVINSRNLLPSTPHHLHTRIHAKPEQMWLHTNNYWFLQRDYFTWNPTYSPLREGYVSIIFLRTQAGISKRFDNPSRPYAQMTNDL
ncbi:hypothetical protein Y032_0052g2209 [Ancylostoma ceylanicum]|uniref:Uncharacterized protein n=1 Tax=Ancylostoma ceylanicum TaxID=53326 RepID=A0A016U716_9BILA|nr:hypothetical protein Y032_0052g2209 [Ancylostoma ceylanicum]